MKSQTRFELIQINARLAEENNRLRARCLEAEMNYQLARSARHEVPAAQPAQPNKQGDQS